jgi:hypothetical protein
MDIVFGLILSAVIIFAAWEYDTFVYFLGLVSLPLLVGYILHHCWAAFIRSRISNKNGEKPYEEL